MAAQPPRPSETTVPTRTGTVFLLGAGFSACLTKGALPVMSGFFDRLARDQHEKLYKFVNSTQGDVCRANVEDTLGLLDQLEDDVARHMAVGMQDAGTLREIRCQLGNYCLGRLQLNSIDLQHWPVWVLASATADTTVITTNYDTVAETVLSRKINATHSGTDPTCHHCRMRRLLFADCGCGSECHRALQNQPPKGAIQGFKTSH